jgi:hypothetical protein
MNLVFSNPSRSRYTSRDPRRSEQTRGITSTAQRLLGWNDKLMHGHTIAASSGLAAGKPSRASRPSCSRIPLTITAAMEVRWNAALLPEHLPECGARRERRLLIASQPEL